MDNTGNSVTDDLFKAILTLENVEECYKLFSDICTPQEISTVSRRFRVAQMLRENRNYSEIVSETGVSTATVSRVKRSLNDENGGYAIVFKRMGK